MHAAVYWPELMITLRRLKVSSLKELPLSTKLLGFQTNDGKQL